MKKVSIIFASIMFLCMLLLTACGDAESDSNAGSASMDNYYVIEAEAAFDVEIANSDLTLLGVQFYQGEAMQLRVEVKKNEAQQTQMDIYACKTDGSRELVAENVSGQYQRHNLFLCADGTCLAWSGHEVLKIGKGGENLFSAHADGAVLDICQMTDGGVYMLIKGEEDAKLWLEQLDNSTGTIYADKKLYLGEIEEYMQYISESETGVYLLNGEGIQEIKLEDGSISEVLSFQDAAYELSVTGMLAFRITGEKEAEILQNSTLEKITGVNVSTERTVLVFNVLGNGISVQSVLEKGVVEFNKVQDDYYVVLEMQEEGENAADYFQRISTQLATGGGPDIMTTNVINAPASLVEKGVFLELGSYMKQSGIKEEDYFPMTFDWYRDGDKIYGVYMHTQPKEAWIAEEFLGGRKVPSVEELVDLLLAYQEPAVFSEGWNSQRILDYFLSGSENLWGMIDWTDRSCEFDSELFAKMLEAAKKYNYDESSKDYPALVGFRRNYNFYRYDSYKEMESEGKVPIGWLFDDGAHVTSNETRAIVINANSKCKGGAWEFVSFLLTEGQYLFEWEGSNTYPMNREAFDVWAQKEIEAGSIEVEEYNGRLRTTYKQGLAAFEELGEDEEAYRALYDLTEERANEIKGTLEDARLLPIETRPILEIIYEEAAAYFADSKTIEEIIPIIENRVGLYLKEKE